MGKNAIRTFITPALIALGGMLPGGVLAQNRADAEDAARSRAAPATVATAMDAPGLSALLNEAGYESVELLPRESEEDITAILIENDGLRSSILFKDCDEAVPDFCETLVLSTRWDRSTPIPFEAVAKANRDYRYISVWRDDDGDPLAQWAIFTGRDGIPSSVFLGALERYLQVVYDYWDVAFEGDSANGSEGESANGAQGEGVIGAQGQVPPSDAFPSKATEPED
ncbi:MAG: YbjN domain-containing protein [Erythrobacter sp.]|uniref:YbjN domain-containing protein n=1 Tax=Erythrobacter sp. TaxID=1042 RepID=UPI0026332844|nr:YbjN domain-containing protein [Erythrobacter sp.]MDJ0977958.1 YbjN domain-containing protein [Erythrobacter sp.]